MNSMKTFIVCAVAFLFHGCKPKEEISIEVNFRFV